MDPVSLTFGGISGLSSWAFPRHDLRPSDLNLEVKTCLNDEELKDLESTCVLVDYHQCQGRSRLLLLKELFFLFDELKGV